VFRDFYLDDSDEGIISLAHVLAGADVELELGCQTLFQVDGPLGIGRIGIETVHLTVQVGNLERLLQRSQFGLLLEPDSVQQRFGSIVQTESQIRQL